MTDAALLELRQLRQAVADLQDDQRHLMRSLLSKDDRRAGAALVPLLAEVFDATFTAAEVSHRALNDRTDAGQALRELVAEHVTDVAGLRAFGRLLARLEGCSFDGCRIVAAGQQHGVARWRVKCT